MGEWTVNPDLRRKLGTATFECLRNLANHLREKKRLFNELDFSDPEPLPGEGFMSFPQQVLKHRNPKKIIKRGDVSKMTRDLGLERRLATSIIFLRKQGYIKVKKVCKKGDPNRANRYYIDARCLKETLLGLMRFSRVLLGIPLAEPVRLAYAADSDTSVSTTSLKARFKAMLPPSSPPVF